MTFSLKLAQPHALEIAEEFEQALEDNSLEKTKKLWTKHRREFLRWKKRNGQPPIESTFS